MQSLDVEGEEEDVFFDARDSEIQESLFEKFEYEVWTRELMSVDERRSRFLQGTGLDEFLSSSFTFSQDHPEGETGNCLERIRENIGAVLDSPPHNGRRDSECCIKDLDSGKRFLVQDFSMLKEVASGKLITLQEFEALLGLSFSNQRLAHEEHKKSINGQKKKHRNWWRSFIAKHRIGICKSDVSVKNPKLVRMMRVSIQQQCKRCLELNALYAGQEIQAHKGLIRVMRFSPSGWYLASGGEDCVVRIWQVGEVEASCKCSIINNPSMNDKKLKVGSKGVNPTPLVIPEKVFKIRETPVQEFRGHTSDILDLTWSNADCLLTSSKDKTVRMWKVGCIGCLKIFQHKDYVTCIQFNPVDHRYFISGSIDGKIRIWGVSENRVVDWADVRDIVTAICYRPDGKGFVVGSITGNCRFYDYSDSTMQLGTKFHVKGKKKSAGKRITGLQFSPEDYERIMVTSADSKVRIFDGVDVVHKFRGLRKTKSHLSASFTSDGRYIVSVGEDSHVYIWNHGTPGSSSSPKGVKSIQPCGHFLSEGVTVALPWPSSNDGVLRLPSPLKIIDSSSWRKDSQSSYLGALFLLDDRSRMSTSWPDEKFTRLRPRTSQVIVTAGSDGSIRSFHDYGLPVRL